MDEREAPRGRRAHELAQDEYLQSLLFTDADGVSMSNLYKDRYDTPTERSTFQVKRVVNAGLASAAAASAATREGGIPEAECLVLDGHDGATTEALAAQGFERRRVWAPNYCTAVVHTLRTRVGANAFAADMSRYLRIASALGEAPFELIYLDYTGSAQTYAPDLGSALAGGLVQDGGVIAATFSSRGKDAGESGVGVGAGAGGGGWSRAHAVYTAVAQAVDGAGKGGGFLQGLVEPMPTPSPSPSPSRARPSDSSFANDPWLVDYVFQPCSTSASRDGAERGTLEPEECEQGSRGGGCDAEALCAEVEVLLHDECVALKSAMADGDLVLVCRHALGCVQALRAMLGPPACRASHEGKEEEEEEEERGGAGVGGKGNQRPPATPPPLRALASAENALRRFVRASGGLVLGAVLLPPKRRSRAPRAMAVLGRCGAVDDGLVTSMLKAADSVLTITSIYASSPPASPGSPDCDRVGSALELSGAREEGAGGEGLGGIGWLGSGGSLLPAPEKVQRFAGSVRLYRGQMFVLAFRFRAISGEPACNADKHK
jgi:hypothetical protein